MAKVFVGVPTRNRPEYLPHAIQSILDQTFRDLRIVVSDNASESSAASSVEVYLRELKEPRLSYFYQDIDIKEYGQGRFLFERCTEEFFVILHDDDVLKPDYLEAALNILEKHPSAAFLVSDPYIFDEKGLRRPDLTLRYLKIHGRGRYPEGEIGIMNPLLSYGHFPISGTLFRSSALRESLLVDPDCEGNYPFEFNVFLRLGELGKSAYYLPRELTGFRFHRKSLRATEATGLNKGMVETLIKLLERRRFSGAIELKRRKTLAYNYRNYAVISLIAGDSRGSLRYLRRAITLNPFSLRNWIFTFLSLFFPFLVKPVFEALSQNKFLLIPKEGRPWG